MPTAEAFGPTDGDELSLRGWTAGDYNAGVSDDYDAVGPGSAMRALSAEFLIGGGLRRALHCSFKAKGGDPTFTDVRDELVQQTSVQSSPRDGLPGAAFVDTIADKHSGKATVMLSYTWGYRINDVLGAIKLQCERERKKPAEVFVWMCIFCINQHRVGAKVPFADFSHEFGARVKACPVMWSVMTPWYDPGYIKRIWCVFELATAIREKGAGAKASVQLLLPPREVDDFILHLNAEDGGIVALSRVFRFLGEMRVQNADATVRSDKDNILRMIAGEGIDLADPEALRARCKPYNRVVLLKLQDWLMDSAYAYTEARLRRAPKLADLRSAAPTALLLDAFALRRERRAEDAVSLLDKALAACTRKDRDAPHLFLTRVKGTFARHLGDIQGAMVCYASAREGYRALGIEERVRRYSKLVLASELRPVSAKLDQRECVLVCDYARLMENISACYAVNAEQDADFFDAALLSRDAYRLSGWRWTLEYGNLLRTVAEVSTRRGQFAAAEELLSQALETFDRAPAELVGDDALLPDGRRYRPTHPWFYSALLASGALHLAKPKPDGHRAMADVKAAIAGLEAIGLDDHASMAKAHELKVRVEAHIRVSSSPCISSLNGWWRSL